MVYLNNAASSWPKPPAVARAVCHAVDAQPHTGPRGGGGAADPALECRTLLGRLFGAPPERFFFTSGATEAFNLVIRGLAPRRVAVTATDHNAVLRPLFALLPEESIRVVPCRDDGTLCPGALREAVKGGVDAIFVNHCSNVTGAVQDIAEAARTARAAGALLVVDAAQSAGVVPLDVEALGIDVLVFTGHKGLFGPAGTGGFYLRRGVPMAAAKFGGTGTEGELVRPTAREMFEVGTLNGPGLAGLAAGLAWVLKEGVEALGARVDAMAQRLAAELACIPGVTVYAVPRGPRGGALGFAVKGLQPADLGYILLHGYGIETRAGHQCAPLFTAAAGLPGGLVRASVSALTAQEDVDALIIAVQEIAQGACQ